MSAFRIDRQRNGVAAVFGCLWLWLFACLIAVMYDETHRVCSALTNWDPKSSRLRVSIRVTVAATVIVMVTM